MKLFNLFLAVLFTWTIASCKKKESNLAPATVEPVENLSVLPGRNRLEIVWTLPDETEISGCIISWNNGKDSLHIPVAAGTDSLSRIIAPLPEGDQRISVTSYTQKGSQSAPSSATVHVYGDAYEDSLINRAVYSMDYDLNSQQWKISWGNAPAGAVGSEIAYVDETGEAIHAFVPVYYSNSTLKIGFTSDDSLFWYRTAYLPEKECLDTFYTDFVAEPVQKQYQSGGLILESLTGPVTEKELNAFKTYLNSYNPNAGQNDGNVWVYGKRGKAIEAAGLMYEATGDVDFLNRMIAYSDMCLAGRNDLAPASAGGQLKAWTGKIEPIWPSGHGTEPAGAGVEQGSVLSHMVFSAKLILQNTALWDVTIPDGNPHQFGNTYKERALTYITQADYVIDHWIVPHFLKTSEQNHYYFPGEPNTYKPNDPAPWNQAFMITDGLVRLIECHVLLKDNPDRVARYDQIVQSNIDWFYANLAPKTSSQGNPILLWQYALNKQTEDANHFAYEAEGLWIAYNAKRYGLTAEKIQPFINTYTDVILAKKTDGHFAGRVDGSTGSGNSGGDSYVRDEYFYFADIDPDIFQQFCQINIDDGKIRTSVPITARILWLKARRNKAGL